MIFMTSMLDPKQEDKVTDFTQERIDALNNTIANLERDMVDARAEIIKYQHMVRDEARDHSIMLAMLQHFVTIAIERGNHDMIRDAIEFVYDDTGIEYEDIAEAVERMGICDPDEYCKKNYIVTATVPVEVSISVQAFSHSDAEDMATNEIDMNGLDNYHMDYDIWQAEFYTEEA